MKGLWVELARDEFVNLSLVERIFLAPDLEEEHDKYKVVLKMSSGDEKPLCFGSKGGCQAKMDSLKSGLKAIRI